MINGGNDCNVFWQVGSSATIDTGTTFIGNILALTAITLNTAANLSGRAFAQNAAVTLDSNEISTAACTSGADAGVSGDAGIAQIDANAGADAGVATNDAGELPADDAGACTADASEAPQPDAAAEPADAGQTEQADAGQTEQPDAGQIEQPDAGQTAQPDAGASCPHGKILCNGRCVHRDQPWCSAFSPGDECSCLSSLSTESLTYETHQKAPSPELGDQTGHSTSGISRGNGENAAHDDTAGGCTSTGAPDGLSIALVAGALLLMRRKRNHS
jgi:hypothetical protein